MKPRRRVFSRDEVLRFSMRPKSRATVRAYYLDWRSEQGIMRRCDNPDCSLHNGELKWNGQDLDLILDHINGSSRDNRPENLQLLCPNCDSQLLTRGGKNRGRIRGLSDGGFEVCHRDGRRDRLVAASSASKRISVGKASVEIKPAGERPA